VVLIKAGQGEAWQGREHLLKNMAMSFENFKSGLDRARRG